MRTISWTSHAGRARTAAAAALVGSALGFLAGLALARWLERTDDAAGDGNLDGLEVEVERRLAAEPALAREEIRVTALAPGIVELWGTAGNGDAAARAVAAARSVPGVRAVLNRILTPDVLAPRDDFALRTARQETPQRADRNRG
jgi:hyperosmotically inducible protein